MADVDESSLFGLALLWTKFNGIIERFSRTYITMGRYLHIIQCKIVELATHSQVTNKWPADGWGLVDKTNASAEVQSRRMALIRNTEVK